MRIKIGEFASTDMPFDFNRTKTVQAAAFLLKQSPRRRESYLKIIKLLYIADRESLKETGRPITGDRFVAMPHGPVLSEVLHLIKGESVHSTEWNASFRTHASAYELELVDDPGIGKLCRHETDTLTRIWQRYEHHPKWLVRDLTHEFPEWKKNDPGRSSKPIPLSDVLEAVGVADRQAQIEIDAAEQRAFSHLFGD